tara:strand:- start:394 stop:2514 length:2121 start_codon:yes stop_codon:yes gene_type:complete
MDYKQIIDKLVKELSFRVGIPNIHNKEHQSIMSEILSEWGEYEVKDTIFEFLTEIDDDTEVTYQNKKGETKKTTYRNAIAADKESPQYKAADALRNKNKTKVDEPEKKDPTKLGAKDFADRPDVKKKKKEEEDGEGTTDSESIPQSNEQVKNSLEKTQSDLQQKRDMGTAGAGGPVASQGESRYCNTMNTFNESDFKEKNKEKIEERQKGLDRKKTAVEVRTAEAIGLDPNSDEFNNYLATREEFAQQELDRIKNIDNSVFYLKGKKGFNGKDEPYLEWMRASYDGTLATRKILDEDTNMDMSKPNTTIQSETQIDDELESKISKRLENAKKNNNQEDIDYFTKELKSFQKFRKYHDTYTVGQDSEGRMCVVSISNKKGDDLRDPQNNTTPAKRFNIIKERFGEDVAKSVVKSIDNGIELVSDVKKASVKATNLIDIDENFVKVCELPQMKKYIDTLDDNKAFVKYVEDKGKSYSSLSTEEKLKLMQEHSNFLLANGKNPAFEPYGKISTKIGEFTQTKKFQEENPSIDFESSSIKKCITIKQNEKNAVKNSHNKVVEDIKGADEKLGFPKDGKNGPHVQGYIGTVMDAMHFDSYIDGGDGKMILQMGIRGAQPQDIRGCLGEKSGFNGDLSTTEGREELKKHLRERCKVDSKSGAIIITNENGSTEICEDTWRTAGTSQKVASHFGKDMRDCISSKVDSRRKSSK